jgi:tetratricopeptide (TPR) repeat protein
MKEVAVTSARAWLFVVLAATIATQLVAVPPSTAGEKIARWVTQLGDDDFQRREEASQRLWEAGEAAEAALRAVADSTDAEVSRRARDILNRFKWGIYPETPKKVVELINQYQAGDRGANGALIKELFENGAAGCKAVLKIARAEDDAGIRRRMFAQISNEMSRSVPMLLAEDDLDTLALMVETVLDHGVAMGDQGIATAIGNYAAFWTLRGQLDERIAQFQARVAKDSDDTKAWEILAYLYRAKGDLPAARAAAAKSRRRALVDDLLLEAGAWKELARRPIGTEITLDSERLGLRAAFCRLSDDAKGFEEAVAALRKVGMEPKGDDVTTSLVAKALFLNDRPADALECLIKSGDRTLAFEVFVDQMNIQEALKLVDLERAAGGKQVPELEILSARTLWKMGEREKARPVFARYGDLINGETAETWYETLIDAECRVGLKEEALKHAALLMGVSKEQNGERRYLDKLFPKYGSRAEVWWDYLRQRAPSRDAADILRQVDEIIRGKLSARQAKELVTEADAALSTLTPRPDVAEQWTLAIAEVALAAGDEDLARVTLEKSTGSAPLQKLGDLLADKKQWKSAAECYRRSAEADRQKPLPLFLRGRALVMCGQEGEGRRRMEQAHWLPLGNEETRLEFALALARRGLTEASSRENELLLRVSQPASYYSGEAQRRVALQAEARKDYLRSADGQERAMLRCLRIYISFVDPGAYVGVPAMIHRHRVRGLLAAGNIDAALREAALSLQELPGDVDVPILIGPALEQAGRTKEADNLFAKTNVVLERLCKDYPKCGWTHNSLAWSSACSRRDLDAGLTHALKAVELDPDVAGFRDTLAEVYFQRGEKKQAIAAQKKAVELDPKKPYYRKQLKRMEVGDPAAPRPPEQETEDDD